MEENNDMEILDEAGNVISMDDVDFETGYLSQESTLKKHHDAIEAVEEQSHMWPTRYYFSDGSEYIVNMDETDPHVGPLDKWGRFTFVPQTVEEQNADRDYWGADVIKVIDVPAVEAHDAWDEYTYFQRYHKYTQEELEERAAAKKKTEKQSKFMEEGPDQLESNTSSIDDLTVLISEMVGI